MSNEVGDDPIPMEGTSMSNEVGDDPIPMEGTSVSNEVGDDPLPIEGSFYTVPVIIRKVTLVDNPTRFVNPFMFHIYFSCTSNVEHDVKWEIIYVGCPNNSNADQCLGSFIMEGPIPVGDFRFVFEAKPPELDQINQEDLRGPSAVILKCSCFGQVFYHRGYFLNNEYKDEKLILDPPENVDVELLQRDILIDHAVIITTPVKLPTN